MRGGRPDARTYDANNSSAHNFADSVFCKSGEPVLPEHETGIPSGFCDLLVQQPGAMSRGMVDPYANAIVGIYLARWKMQILTEIRGGIINVDINQQLWLGCGKEVY